MKTLNNYINEQRIDERVSINRLLTKYTEAGYIMITAFRHENDAETNNKLNKELQGLIKAAGYSWVPVKGGYLETSKSGETVPVTEKTFLVPNFHGKNPGKMEDLKSLGIEWAKKYRQDSVLVVEPGKNPTYYTGDGEVDMEFDGKTTIDNMAEQFFTKLGNHQFSYKEGSAVTEMYVETINGKRSADIHGRLAFLRGYENRHPDLLND